MHKEIVLWSKEGRKGIHVLPAMEMDILFIQVRPVGTARDKVLLKTRPALNPSVHRAMGMDIQRQPTSAMAVKEKVL